MDHDEFRKTAGYRELCAEFGIDPAAGWGQETLASIDDAAEFLEQYERMRHACTPYEPGFIAAYFEALAVRCEAEPGAVIVVDRYGEVLLVQDPLGGCWEFTAAAANPDRVAQALARARITSTPPN